MTTSVLDVRELKTYFFTRAGVVKAVDGVSFALGAGETMGLVGESGCGKSVTCLSILRLVPAPVGRIVGGKILLEGDNLLEKSEADMRRIRGREISLIPQDPMTSLNPVLSIGDQIMEPIQIHQRLRGRSLREKATEMLNLVGIASAERRLRDFPHQMSGGMRQRIVGAAALSCEPRLIIADEPTTSLDVTIQAQYLTLLKNIQERTRVAMIFVTHDFGIVARVCDKVAVMYAGKIVETGDVAELFDHPAHPYTSALMKSVPKLEEKTGKLASIGGQPPSLSALPTGCSFSPRCFASSEKCQQSYPPEVSISERHWVCCWQHV